MHYLAHVALDLEKQLQTAGPDGLFLNPGLFATQAAEDWIGKSCNIAKNCSPKNGGKKISPKVAYRSEDSLGEGKEGKRRYNNCNVFLCCSMFAVMQRKCVCECLVWCAAKHD